MKQNFSTNLAKAVFSEVGGAAAGRSGAYQEITDMMRFSLRDFGLENMPYPLIAAKSFLQAAQQNPQYGKVVLTHQDETLNLPFCNCVVVGGNRVARMPVSGKAQTHKQITAQDDYRISIDGWVAGPNQAYPEEQHTLLNRFMQLGGPFEVQSTYLQLFGISQLFIESVHWPGNPGVPHAFSFLLTAWSEPSAEVSLPKTTTKL